MAITYLNQYREGYKQILKCIGGPLDGQWKFVPDSIRIGDHFRVQEEFKLSSKAAPLTADELALSLTINYFEYRICVFHFNKDEAYKFLAINTMSDKEAILHQFSK